MQTLKFGCYDEFACTGPECEDSCCKHWTISLTKREYLDFKKLDCSPELKAVIDSAFKRVKDGEDFKYARMELKEDGSCPFLGEDRLCMLQKEKGESALTLVCSSFPRNWAKIGEDAVAFSLTPTCYHVVELLMQHPEGLVLMEEEYGGENRWINKSLWTGVVLNGNEPAFPYIWSIKTAQLDILQNRDFTTAERLLILGYYTQKVCDYLENSPEKIGQLGAMMLDKELCRKIADSLKPPQTEQQALAKSTDILFKLTENANKFSSKSRVTRLINLINVIADNVGLKYELIEGSRYATFVNSNVCAENRELYEKLERERPHITENLLVMLAFSRFPKNGEQLWGDYFSLAVLYNFLRYYLAAFLPENFTDKELAMGITNMVKVIINANSATNLTMRDFAEHGMNSLSYVAFLIS